MAKAQRCVKFEHPYMQRTNERRKIKMKVETCLRNSLKACFLVPQALDVSRLLDLFASYYRRLRKLLTRTQLPDNTRLFELLLELL